MTIYDVKFYGVYYPKSRFQYEIKMSENLKDVLRKESTQGQLFEVKVLNSFKGKKDILMLQFEDGTSEFETLYGRGYYYEDGVWKETNYRKAQEAFWMAYRRLSNKKQLSIFDVKFYGALSRFDKDKVIVDIDKENIEVVGSENKFFTATVLVSLFGSSFVVKVEDDEGKIEYLQLFDSETYYDQKANCWKGCTKNAISGEIMKCYIKYLNK